MNNFRFGLDAQQSAYRLLNRVLGLAMLGRFRILFFSFLVFYWLVTGLGCADESGDKGFSPDDVGESSHGKPMDITNPFGVEEAREFEIISRSGDFLPEDVSSGGEMEGFVGSSCGADGECDYEGGFCFFDTQGFPGGTCSRVCERLCPDREGFPVTFCVAGDALPQEAGYGGGACLSRCDFDIYPGTGCRPQYGCVEMPRFNEQTTEKFSCLPGVQTELSACGQRLVDRGASFTPTVIADRSPSSHPDLNCHVEEPVVLHSPLLGVNFVSYNGNPTPMMTMSCAGAQALLDTIEDLKPYGVNVIRHIGTYVCRVIAGTNSLSRHAFGDAIDIYGFEFTDGSYWTLVDDWEHDTEIPTTDAGKFLYESAQRWHDGEIWNTILTPNYNAGHDNHYHVDLDPRQEFLGMGMNPSLGFEGYPYGD